VRTCIKIGTHYNTPNKTKSPAKHAGLQPSLQTGISRKERIMRIAELDRINELARKAKSVGLSEAELAERAALRQAYLHQVCGQMKNILSTVTVVDPEGNDVTPAKLREAQAGNMQVH
jgi:uncharacterized protein YnzC (UPF0291/DUF896 family)